MSIADLRFYSPFSHVLMFSQYNSNLLSRTDGTGSVLGDGLSLRLASIRTTKTEKQKGTDHDWRATYECPLNHQRTHKNIAKPRVL